MLGNWRRYRRWRGGDWARVAGWAWGDRWIRLGPSHHWGERYRVRGTEECW